MMRRRERELPGSPRHAPLEGDVDEGEAGDATDGDATREESTGHGPAEERGLELSADQLSPEALQGLVEEFVSREGTDYGHADRSLESKVAAVHRQLETGEARIVFDLESETASIVTSRELERRGR
jgi:uncharacterized protein